MASLSDRLQLATLTLTVLPSPKRRPIAMAYGFWDGQVFGDAEAGKGGASLAHLWASGTDAQELILPKIKEPMPRFGHGETAVGRYEARGGAHAAIFKRAGTDVTLVDLHHKQFSKTWANGSDAKQQIGGGDPKDPNINQVALLWSGSADSVVELRGKEPNRVTDGYAVLNGVQVGVYGPPSEQHAMLWRGSSASAVDLNPAEDIMSEAHALDSDGVIGGFFAKNDYVSKPCIWQKDSAASFTDLTPTGCSGGSVRACVEGVQAGSVMGPGKGEREHAALWGGSGKDFFDLHAAVKESSFNRSGALALELSGRTLRIAGWASVMSDGEPGALWQKEKRAVVWEIALK